MTAIPYSLIASTCNSTDWFHNADFGVVNYANMVVYQSAQFSQVRFSEYSSSLAEVSTSC